MDRKMQVPNKDELKYIEEDIDDDEAVVSSEWSKQNVYQLMKNYPDRVTLMEYEGAQIIPEFSLVLIDGKPIDLVKCNDCIALFDWYAQLESTSLLQHRCNGTIQEEAAPNEKDCIDAEQQLIIPMNIPQSAISSLNDSMVVGLVKDLQPLKKIESKGFLAICQQMVNFGAEYGNQDVTKIIKSRRVMKDIHMTKIAESVRDDLRRSITAIRNYPRFTFTFDLLTDPRKQRDFLLLKCHFINSQFQLQSSLMGVQKFSTDVMKTTVNIREHCKKILAAYFSETLLENLLNDSIVVTNENLNLNGVFPTKLPCMCHKLNMVLENTLSEGNLESHPEIKLALSTLKAFVTYFKKSGLNSQLKYSLKQSVSTCWKSQVKMIESYLKSCDVIQAILIEKKQVDGISGLNVTILRDFLKVISPFKLALEEFSTENNVTVDKIVPIFFLLSKYLTINKDDSGIIKKLKLNMNEWFIKYYTLENIHIAATALNPRFKSLKLVSTEQKEAAYRFIREKLINFKENSNADNLEPAPPKLLKTCLSLSDLVDSDDELGNIEVDELTAYLQTRKPKHNESRVTALKYWENATEFPNLREIALWLLAIPVSACSEDATFSVNEQVKTKRRYPFGGESADDFTMIHKNHNMI